MDKDKDLIRNIQHLVRCPNCNASYETGHISILGGLGEIFLVHLDCSFCGMPVLATVMIRQEGMRTEVAEDILKFDQAQVGGANFQALKPKREKVTSDDVLNMHEFLKGFDGDFESIFKS